MEYLFSIPNGFQSFSTCHIFTEDTTLAQTINQTHLSYVSKEKMLIVVVFRRTLDNFIAKAQGILLSVQNRNTSKYVRICALSKKKQA